MTEEEANAAIKKRYGPRAYASTDQSAGCFFHIEREPVISMLGTGRTWEEALEDVERRTWIQLHPFRINWVGNSVAIFLRAECDRCKLASEMRVKIDHPLWEGWQARAETAERIAHGKIATNPKWRRCTHKGSEIRPDRDALRVFAPKPH